MKVSIIVPVHNVTQYIARCVESLQNQEYSDIEIILVDDGSTDSSGCICDRYANADARIKVIHQENSGVSSARNTGIKAASGEYICFVDGDDYVQKDYVSYLLQLALKTNVPVAITSSVMSDFDNKSDSNRDFNTITGYQATVKMLSYRFPIGCYSKIFKKRFLLDHNIFFFESLSVGEGFNFNCLAFQNAKRITVGEHRIYHYRKDNPNSVTTFFNQEKWKNGLHAIDVINKNLLFHTSELDNCVKYAYWRTATDAYDLIVLSNSQKQCKDFYNLCYRVTRKYAFRAFTVPVSAKDRIRAVVLFICPPVIPWVMSQRRRIKHVKVKTQR